MSKGCGCALTCLCYSLQIDAVQLLQCIYTSILLAVLLLQCNCQTNNTAKVLEKHCNKNRLQSPFYLFV